MDFFVGFMEFVWCTFWFFICAIVATLLGRLSDALGQKCLPLDVAFFYFLLHWSLCCSVFIFGLLTWYLTFFRCRKAEVEEKILNYGRLKEVDFAEKNTGPNRIETNFRQVTAVRIFFGGGDFFLEILGNTSVWNLNLDQIHISDKTRRMKRGFNMYLTIVFVV